MSPPYPEPAAEPGRGWRLLLVLVLVLPLTVGVSLAASAPAAPVGRGVAAPAVVQEADRVPPLWMPVAGGVVRGFDARAGPYGPGHRGIDVAAPVGEVVRAPAAGRVVFAGQVAGTTWISLEVAPGVVVTLGPLLGAAVAAGPVRARIPLGRVGPGHGPATRAGRGGLPSGATLHLGVRVDGVYVDPLAYLVDRPRARLAPLLAPGGLRER